MRRSKGVGLVIAIILTALLFGGFETNAEILFPENPVISGIESHGYTITEDNHNFEFSNHTKHHIVYLKPWEPAPWNAEILLELYLFDTSDLDYTSFYEVITFQEMMVDLKDDPTMGNATSRANEPNFSWIDHSYDLNEASRAYNYMDYFYGYGSPDAELRIYDAKLDGNDLLSRGDYIVLAEPFAYRISITDVPAWEYASIKSSVFEYVESIIGQYVEEEITTAIQEEAIQEEETKDETIKVNGRLINSDLFDPEILSGLSEITEEQVKRLSKIGDFMNAPSQNQLIFMFIVDFEGNELASYGPVMTDSQGRFDFDYPYDIADKYDMFIVMPLAHYPGNNTTSPSLGVKDWVYTGGTQNSVILELAAEEINISDEEEEIDLEDLYIHGGDTRRYLTRESKDTDFVNGFIYANSYLYALLAEQFYHTMLAYELPAVNDKPLIIYHNANKVMPKGIGGNYDHLANYINLSDGVSTWYGMHDLSTAVYHEISHKVMFDLYGNKYPSADKDDWLIGTYGNKSTANSLTEGFAYFMQNAISEYYGGKGLIDTSPVYGHIEPNFPAWFEGGQHEARAVSGVLYDLYDQGRDGAGLGLIVDDDAVVIPLKDLLKLILEAPLDSVGQLYDKLILTYPSQKKGIDQIFIDHGFFSVAKPKIEDFGTYHVGEAFVDANKNFKYDEKERVINFNAIEEDGFRYQKYVEGAKIGYAAYSGNEARQMMLPDPKFSIKVNTDYPVYAYDILFIDEPYLNYSGTALAQDGFVQMPLLPYNHNMKINVYPAGQWSADRVFTMTSSDIKNNYATIMQQGYLAEWQLEDFDLSTDYISPLITMIGGDSELTQNVGQGDSRPSVQLSEYDFTQAFIENPYVRPQEVVDEVAIVTEAPIEETRDIEVVTPEQTTTALVDSTESPQEALDNGSGLVDRVIDLISGGSEGMIIVLAMLAVGGIFTLIGIIYGIVKMVKR